MKHASRRLRSWLISDVRQDEMTELLAKDLAEIAVLLERDGDKHWSAWLHQDAADLKEGDLRGAHHFLSAFGGMGSINDSYGYAPVNKKEEELSPDEKIAMRLSGAWNLARVLVGKRNP